MIFVNNRLNSAYVLFICFKLQILAIEWPSVTLLLRKRWSTWMGSKLILSTWWWFFFPSFSSFFALCLSTVVFWILGPCLWISMVVFGVLILCLSSRTDVHKTMDRLNQGGRNSLLLHFSQILWKVSSANFCINFIVELFVLIKNVKKKCWMQGMVIYNCDFFS